MEEVPREGHGPTGLSARIERIITTISPRWGFHRARDRMRIQAAHRLRAMMSGYRGAKKDRRHSSWLPGSGSADEELLNDLPDLRERSRDLNRNTGAAAGCTRTAVVNTIGTGIQPQSRLPWEQMNLTEEQAEALQQQMEDVWAEWVRWADASGRQDFYEIQALCDRQWLESGEFILLRQSIDEPGRPLRFALQVIEPDRLATPTSRRSETAIREGVEIGDRGQPVAYHIRHTHPGDISYGPRGGKAEYERIAARDDFGSRNIWHCYEVERPGQSRGIPWFAPVLANFRGLAEYEEAELMAARIAACLALMIESPYDAYAAAEGAAADTKNSQRLEELEPGMIRYLQPGEKLSSFLPNRPNAQFDPFVKRMLEQLACGLGLPYEVLFQSFAGMNYSNARTALLAAYRYFRNRQQFHIRHYCREVWELVMEEAWLRGKLKIPDFARRRRQYVKMIWIPQGWEWVDPETEVNAAIKAIDANLKSKGEVIAATGRDRDSVFAERAREKRAEEKLEIAPAEKQPAVRQPSQPAQPQEKTENGGK